MTKRQQEKCWRELLKKDNGVAYNRFNDYKIRQLFRFDLARQYYEAKVGSNKRLADYIWYQNSEIDKKQLLNYIRQKKLDVIRIYNCYTGGCMNIQRNYKGIVQNTKWLLDSEYGKQIYEYLLTRQHDQYGLYVTQEILKYFKKKWNLL